MNDLLTIKGVTKKYGNKKVLTGIDLTVCKGEFVVVKGQSGCGKSTLLNIVGLLDSFNGGAYLFHGQNVQKPFRRNRLRVRELGFIFQSYCLLENLSVIDNLLMPILYSNKAVDKQLKKQIAYYLDLFQLKQLKNEKAKILSGGEKQRVAIARALLKEPSLILADEPTGNLDAVNSKIIYEELKKMTKAGTAVVTVTHNPELFQEVDSSYILTGGELHYE